MARQVLHLVPQPREQPDAIGIQIEADRGELARERIGRIGELELVHHLREPIDLRGVEAERLADFARGAAAAVGDHVGGHRRPQPAVLLVDVLDHPLAPVAARQIEIDVGPLAALFRQEPLEQEIHPDRIDRRDAEAVAHGAVRRGAASLHEDVLLAAVVDDVPDDQEVAGEIELLDQIELAGDLRAGAVVKRPVAIAGAELGDAPRNEHLRFAGRHRVVGEPVAEIGHRVLQPIGELARARHRVRVIAEERRHLVRRLSDSARRSAPGACPACVEVGVMMDAGEHVEQRPRLRRREPDAVGDEGRHAERRGQLRQRLVRRLLVAAVMPLQLDVGAIAAEDADQAIDQPADAEASGRRARRGPPARRAPRRPVELVERERPFSLRRSHLHARDQAAEIAIALGGFTEDGQEKGLVRQARSCALDFSPPAASPAPIVSSAPTIGRMPAARAAL